MVLLILRNFAKKDAGLCGFLLDLCVCGVCWVLMIFAGFIYFYIILIDFAGFVGFVCVMILPDFAIFCKFC